VRAFIDEWRGAVRSTPVDMCRPPIEVTLVTGELFAPVLREESTLAGRHGVSCRVLPVVNRFFGGNVSVTGLLTGTDIAGSIRSDGSRGTYLVPDIILNDDDATLDGWGADQLRARAGADIRVVSCDAAGLLASMLALSDERSG